MYLILEQSLKKITLTFDGPTSDKIYGTNNDHYLQIQIWFDAGSLLFPLLGQQSGTFDIAQVQLEEGSVATPFENRPIGLELSLCQRYYENTYSNGVGVGSASALGAKFSQVGVVNVAQGFTFIEPKRIPPTVTIYSPAGTLNGVWISTDTNSRSVYANNIGTKGVRYLSNGAINWTVPSYITFHYIADAEL